MTRPHGVMVAAALLLTLAGVLFALELRLLPALLVLLGAPTLGGGIALVLTIRPHHVADPLLPRTDSVPVVNATEGS